MDYKSAFEDDSEFKAFEAGRKVGYEEGKKDVLTNKDNTPLTEDALLAFDFAKEEIEDRDGDIFIWFIKDGISIYDHTGEDQGYSYATYIKGDGQFKGGYTIATVRQLKDLYKALTQRELTLKEPVNKEV